MRIGRFFPRHEIAERPPSFRGLVVFRSARRRNLGPARPSALLVSPRLGSGSSWRTESLRWRCALTRSRERRCPRMKQCVADLPTRDFPERPSPWKPGHCVHPNRQRHRRRRSKWIATGSIASVGPVVRNTGSCDFRLDAGEVVASPPRRQGGDIAFAPMVGRRKAMHVFGQRALTCAEPFDQQEL